MALTEPEALENQVSASDIQQRSQLGHPLVFWDADFMLGPIQTDGSDNYVLGEINVSSVHPYPDQAPAEIARRAAERLQLKL